MYRQVGDRKPSDKQVSDLNTVQERFSEPMPQPKNFIEATILKLDNVTDAEKSASLRGQLTKLDGIIEREELQKTETVKDFGQTDEYDIFGRTDNYFTQRLHRLEMNLPQGKSYFELTSEAQERGLIQPQFAATERAQEQQMQQALYQLGIANALQEQMKRSLDEQGIKLKPLAERIINATIDKWAKQPPAAAEYKSVQDIHESGVIGITPETKLEAKAYVFANSDERERDKISSSLATAASEKADEIKIKEAQEQAREQEKSNEMERDYEDYSQGRSM
jgi:hypothetical protein